MAVTLNWLKDYIDVEWNGEDLAERLTRAGIAFEGAEAEGDDWILETDLTPNRGDCQGYINLAREVAALTGGSIRLPEFSLVENQENIDDYIKVSIEQPDLCRRYTARLIKNVKLGPSPEWMQERLIKSGIRPISNIVDITNYVMLECNQPLHAFDYDLLDSGKHIIVRQARSGEQFTTLDDVERRLDEDMLLITEGERAVALAGIMGGQNTEINDGTVNVLLESAHFDRICIRKTSRKLALRSDSSVRFGKGTDIEGVVFAADRAAWLMMELAGGEVVGGICDCYPGRTEPLKVVLRPERVNYLLGTGLSSSQIKSYLDALTFKIEDKDGLLEVEVPAYRPDITIEADLIEEVARLYGYDNIPATMPERWATQSNMPPHQKMQDQVKDVVSASMYEIVTYSFISPSWLDRLTLPGDSVLRNVLKVSNPLSEEQSIMRTTLLPGMLDTISRNQARQNDNLAFFEMGAVFSPSEGLLPNEKLILGGIATGRTANSWMKSAVDMDYYYLKGVIENLLQVLGIEDAEFLPGHAVAYHPGRTARIQVRGMELGILGEIHPLVQQNFEIKGRTTAFELDMELLYKFSQSRRMKHSISRFPTVERDIALLVDEASAAADLLAIIKENGGEFMREASIIDVYTGSQIPAGMKSLAFKMIFQAADNTLSDNQITPLMENIIGALESRCGAKLRA